MRGTSQRVGAECTFLPCFAPSQGGVPECRCVEHLSEVALSVRPLALPPTQGGVPECRFVELLSELVLSVLSLAFSHLLREVPLSVGAGNPSARCRSVYVPSLFRTFSGRCP